MDQIPTGKNREYRAAERLFEAYYDPYRIIFGQDDRLWRPRMNRPNMDKELQASVEFTLNWL